MRKAFVLVALYVAFAVGAVATCLFGRAGISSYRSLRQYADRLAANIAELEAANAALTEEFELLRSDRESVQILARALGYYARGERRVILETYDPPRPTHEVGFVLLAPAEGGSRSAPRETLYLAPLVLLFLVFCVQVVRGRRDG